MVEFFVSHSFNSATRATQSPFAVTSAPGTTNNLILSHSHPHITPHIIPKSRTFRTYRRPKQHTYQRRFYLTGKICIKELLLDHPHNALYYAYVSVSQCVCRVNHRIRLKERSSSLSAITSAVTFARPRPPF